MHGLITHRPARGLKYRRRSPRPRHNGLSCPLTCRPNHTCRGVKSGTRHRCPMKSSNRSMIIHSASPATPPANRMNGMRRHCQRRQRESHGWPISNLCTRERPQGNGPAQRESRRTLISARDPMIPRSVRTRTFRDFDPNFYAYFTIQGASFHPRYLIQLEKI